MKNVILRSIVREELEKIKQQPLVEYFGQSRVDPSFKISEPWPGTEKYRENSLKRLGGQPFKAGINLHGYEVDTANDRFWFYHDGYAWSTNATRDLWYVPKENGVIELWNEKDGNKKDSSGEMRGFRIGVLKRKAGKIIFVPDTQPKKPESPESKPNTTLDTLQTVGDWLGLIPGIGDAIDIVNGLVYLIRGKYFDAVLSLIAVIPIIGSAIKLGAKTLYRGTKLVKIEELVRNTFKAKDQSTAALKLWDDLVKNGVITADQLKDVGSGLQSLTSFVDTIRSGVKKVGVNNDVLKQLDELEQWMLETGKAAERFDELVPAAKRALDAKAIFKAAPELNGMERFAKFISLNGYKRIRNLAWFKEAKLGKIAAGLEKRFLREMADPTKMTAIFKTAPEMKKMRSAVKKTFMDFWDEMPDATKALLGNKMRPYAYMSGGINDVNKLLSMYLAKPGNSKFMNQFFNALQQTPETKGLFDSMAYMLAKNAKETNSIVWSSFATSNINNLKTVLSRDMIQSGQGIYKNLDLSMRKNADVIWNEVHDMFEDVGVEARPGQLTTNAKYDEIDGLMWPMIKSGVAEYFPGTYDSANDVAKWTRSMLDSDVVQGAEEFLKNKEDEPYIIKGKGKYA